MRTACHNAFIAACDVLSLQHGEEWRRCVLAEIPRRRSEADRGFCLLSALYIRDLCPVTIRYYADARRTPSRVAHRGDQCLRGRFSHECRSSVAQAAQGMRRPVPADRGSNEISTLTAPIPFRGRPRPRLPFDHSGAFLRRQIASPAFQCQEVRPDQIPFVASPAVSVRVNGLMFLGFRVVMVCIAQSYRHRAWIT